MAAKGFFPCSELIGGGTGALDKINSATGKIIDAVGYALETGDSALVVTGNGIWFFRYDASSTASEDATNYTVIKPDNLGPTDPGRWIKKYHVSSWKAPSEVAIASGVAALSGQGSYKITVESGTSDDLDKLTGLEEGHQIILAPTDGTKTVTVKQGTYLKLQDGKDFDMNNEYDRIVLLCLGNDVCQELSRLSGGD